MRYREYQPRSPLNRFVECFWTLESESNSETATAERILPDGCVELILNFGARFSQHDDGKTSLQPQNLLVGQMTGPILISPTGVVELMGIRFQPGGTVPFLQTPMYEFTDRVTDFACVSPTLHRSFLKVTQDLSGMAERVAAIELLLLGYLSGYKQDSWLLPLAARVVTGRGLISVDHLATIAGVSNRQLERRFLQEVGIGPKLLSRILRFQQVFRAVERCDGGWAPVAFECGYYDQAHLIRDFNQFAHQTPSVLFAEQSSLSQSFTRKTRTSDFSNTPE